MLQKHRKLFIFFDILLICICAITSFYILWSQIFHEQQIVYDFTHKSLKQLYLIYNGKNIDKVVTTWGYPIILSAIPLMITTFLIKYLFIANECQNSDNYEELTSIILMSWVVFAFLPFAWIDIKNEVSSTDYQSEISRKANRELAKYTKTHKISTDNYIQKENNTFIINHKKYVASNIETHHSPNKTTKIIITYKTNNTAPKYIKAYATDPINNDQENNDTVKAVIET